MPGGLTELQTQQVQTLLASVQTQLNHDAIRSGLHGAGNPTNAAYQGAKSDLASAKAIVDAGA